MRVLLFSLAASGLVLAAPAFADGPEDTASLSIDTVRLDAMIDQSEEALSLLAPKQNVEEVADTGVQDVHAFPSLVAVVSRYNLVEARACNARVVSPKLCGDYRPA